MSKPPSGYPRYAPAGYPQQPQQQQQYYQPSMVPAMYPAASYPQPQSFVPINQPMQPTSSPYGIPPPPYTSTPHQMYSQAGPQPSYSLQHAQASQMRMMPSTHHGGVIPATQGSYDAGARFGVGATHNIPPPPPGCQANQAQIATAQGRPVVMRQNPDSWLSGGSDGGYTVW